MNLMVLASNTKGWEYPQDVACNVMNDDTGAKWYLLDCRYAFGDWIEQHDQQLWRVHGSYHYGRYWVHEKLMSLILLKGC